jgi:methionine-rich copper-binding protein CopC
VRRLAAAAVLALALAGAWSAAMAAPASAHAAIERTEPGNGALLDDAPDRILLAFTEAPDPSLTTITLVDAAGDAVPTGAVELVADTDVAVGVRDLADGVYTVSWRTVSRVDGPVTSGAFSFGIGVDAGEVAPVPQAAGGQAPPPTVLAVAGRWSLYVGLVVLFGGALAGLIWLGARPGARAWLLASAWALAAAGTIVITLEERRAVGVPLGTLLASDSGEAFVRLGVGVAVAGVGALAAARGRRAAPRARGHLRRRALVRERRPRRAGDGPGLAPGRTWRRRERIGGDRVARGRPAPRGAGRDARTERRRGGARPPLATGFLRATDELGGPACGCACSTPTTDGLGGQVMIVAAVGLAPSTGSERPPPEAGDARRPADDRANSSSRRGKP